MSESIRLLYMVRIKAPSKGSQASSGPQMVLGKAEVSRGPVLEIESLCAHSKDRLIENATLGGGKSTGL